jgi:class 3 adenylate cyclase
MERHVRYCTTSDGVRIAYCIEGRGPPVVVGDYIMESFANDSHYPGSWHDLIARIGHDRQLIRFDARGSGLSQRDNVQISLWGFVEDVKAVATAAGLPRFDVVGWLFSGILGVAYAARYPDDVRRLAVYSGFASPSEAMPADARRAIAALCRSNWQVASQTVVDLALRQESTEIAVRVAEGMRRDVNADILAQAFEIDIDLTDQLHLIQAPTLVLHRTNDSTVPFAASQKLASLIPNARLVPLKGDVSYPALGDWEQIADAVDAFLREGTGPLEEPAEQSGFRTVLFTDMVGHTAMMQRLGDDRGRAVLREHERITRAVLNTHDGREIKTMGDGFMASFPSATRAVECAIALQRSFADHAASADEPISIRVGLNAGEPVAEEGDLFGASVILAARITALAGPGEVLVSEAVRQIVAGKQFLLSDRGPTALRGFEDPVHVYDLSWRA